MSGARDLKALAERYLDLWERQLAAMADDPGLLARFSRFLADPDGSTYGGATLAPEPPAPLAGDDGG